MNAETVDEGGLVKTAGSEHAVNIPLIPIIDKLPDDPDWEQFERKAGENASKRVPPFEE